MTKCVCYFTESGQVIGCFDKCEWRKLDKSPVLKFTEKDVPIMEKACPEAKENYFRIMKKGNRT